MIIFKLGIVNTKEYKYELEDGETLDKAISRVLELHFEERYTPELDKYFIGVVNGIEVDTELSHMTALGDDDTILIVPDIKGGGFGQVFKTVAIITITAIVATYAPGLTGSQFGGALLTATAAIGATLALNALIPPPGAGNSGALGYNRSSQEFTDSQTYVLDKQSNTTKRFGFVPRVYGTNRIFPIVAANPYTQLENFNGDIVQYYYCIYDFGIGPLEISDLRIGDTPLVGLNDGNAGVTPTFSDVQYRLVDVNKPAVSTGTWDDSLSDTFQIYKGDVETDNLVYALNKDQSPSLPASEYQVTRVLSDNAQGDSQEIIIDFTFPRGLIAYDAAGVATERQVEIKIEYAEVGTSDWKNPTDPDEVYDFSVVGSFDLKQYIGTSPSSLFSSDSYAFDTHFDGYVVKLTDYHGGDNLSHLGHADFGHATGSTTVLAAPGVPIGARLYNSSSNELLGIVLSSQIVPLPDFNTSATQYTLDRPISSNIVTWIFNRDLVGRNRHGSAGTPTFYPYPVSNPFYYVNSTTNKFAFNAKTNKTYYSTISFKPINVGQYKVRITRLASSGGSSLTVDFLNISKISTRFNRDPILTTKRHVFLEIRIKATNQLNGALQNLSGVAKSVLDVYDENTLTWNKEITSNPAWIYTDLLTGEVNSRAIDKSRLDLNSILEWRDFCDEVPTAPPTFTWTEPRFSINFILDYETTLQGVIDQVTHSSQASLNIIDGKYGVLLDKQRTTPVQIFTPRNSWGFSSSRSYIEEPDCLRIQYVEPASGWRSVETNVFAEGKDINNYETVEEMVAFGCLDGGQAWRFGRYMQAQAILRQETITIKTDFEYLVCNRGDYVQITQDVMQVGGTPARVKSVAGSQIVIDTDVAIQGGESYGYVFRDVSGVTAPSTLTVDDDNTFTLDGTIPAVGDLIIIGIVGQTVFDCLVKSIVASNDLTAELVLVEKADGVYEAESTSTLPGYESFLVVPPENFAAPDKVENLQLTENTWRVKGGDYEFYMTTTWEVPLLGVADAYEVYVEKGTGVFDLVNVINSTSYEYIITNEADLGIEHCFKVLAVSANGDKISLVDADQVCDTPVDKTTPPSDVEGLFINITNETLQLEWTPVADLDIKEFLIRYSPSSTSTWESSIPLARVTNDTTTTTIQARTGKYLIKALDLNINQSENAASAFTSIPELFNLNVVDETNDFPDLLGSKDRVNFLDASSIVLEETVSGVPSAVEYESLGYYYYKDLLDVGDIYTVRLQSLIEAEGYSPLDLMSNWVTLDSVAALSNSGYADWDVETQVRYTDAYNVIANWAPMGDVALMSEGDADVWGPWTKFVMGDFTGRIFQFRLKLISYQLNSTPRVFNGVIKADMPDRIESFNNIVSSAVADTEVVYTPAFFGPGTTPAIEITQDNMQQGDYFQFVSKSLSKLVINFYDKNDVRVSRQFDAVVKGYGRQYTESIY
jgi:hypothetical protein